MQLSEELCVCVCELLADADTKLLAQCGRTLIFPCFAIFHDLTVFIRLFQIFFRFYFLTYWI